MLQLSNLIHSEMGINIWKCSQFENINTKYCVGKCIYANTKYCVKKKCFENTCEIGHPVQV